MTVFPTATLGNVCYPTPSLRVALRPVLLEACAATNQSSPYSEVWVAHNKFLIFQKPHKVHIILSMICKFDLVLAAASNKSATQPLLPPPRCGGEWKETGRNWWVGIRAVNRTANKGNRNNNDTEKGEYTKQTRRTEPLSRTEPPLCPPEPRVSTRRAAHPHRNPAWWHMV